MSRCVGSGGTRTDIDVCGTLIGVVVLCCEASVAALSVPVEEDDLSLDLLFFRGGNSVVVLGGGGGCGCA